MQSFGQKKKLGEPVIWDNFSDLKDNTCEIEESEHDDYSDDFGDTKTDIKPFLASAEMLGTQTVQQSVEKKPSTDYF